MTEPLETLEEAKDRYNALHQVLTLIGIVHRLLPDYPDAPEATMPLTKGLAELERLIDTADKAVSEQSLRPMSPRPH